MSSFGILLVPAVVILVIVWLARSGRRSTRLSVDEHFGEQDYEFRIKPAVRVLTGGSILCGILVIGAVAVVPNPGYLDWLIFGGLGLAWTAGATWLSVKTARARVRIGSNSVHGHWPGAHFDMPFKDIKSASLAGLGSVVLEPFSGKKVEIVPYFENTHDIWRLISARIDASQERSCHDTLSK